MISETVAAYGAVISLVIISILTWKTRVGPALITMGLEDDKELRAAVRQAMLDQNRISFWLVIVSGALAAVVLFVAITLMASGQTNDILPKVIQIVCGLGNTALFRYFYKVWRESREVLVKMT